MATGRTLSQITASSANVALTDFLVGVHGNNDVLFSPTQIGSGSSVSAFYVDGAAGNDGNSGNSPAAAWKTITKVNASTFQPGQAILFAGGQTFSGSIVCPSGGTAAAPITFGSYGGGRATISSGTSNGFTSQNQSGIVVRDLIVTGSSSTNYGVLFNNNLSGNVHLQNIQAINLNVSGYGFNGIFVTGSNGSAGYDDVVIDGCTASACTTLTGGAQTNIGTAGILVGSGTGFGLNTHAPSFNNVKIINCISHDNTGAIDLTNWTGSGIFIGETNLGVIDKCLAYNNGASANNGSGGGPGGIWTGDSTNIVITNSNCHDQQTATTADGSGFGIDEGCINCTIRDCFARDNAGPGFQIFSGTDTGVTGNDRCSILDCLSINDGKGASNNAPIGIGIGGNNPSTTNIVVSGCTVYQSNANTRGIGFIGSQAAAVTGQINDNTIIVSSTQPVVYTTVNPSVIQLFANRYVTSITAHALIVWNGVTYNSPVEWAMATGQEATSSVHLAQQLEAQQVNIRSPGPAISLIDTRTNGGAFEWFAELTGTTPYFSLSRFEPPLDSDPVAFNFDGLAGMQVQRDAVIGWSTDPRYADGAVMDTGVSRIAPVSSVPTIAIGNGTPADASGTIKAKTKAGAPSASDVPAGTWALIRDTTNSTTKLYYNNAGSLMTVALT